MGWFHQHTRSVMSISLSKRMNIIVHYEQTRTKILFPTNLLLPMQQMHWNFLIVSRKLTKPYNDVGELETISFSFLRSTSAKDHAALQVNSFRFALMQSSCYENALAQQNRVKSFVTIWQTTVY